MFLYLAGALTIARTDRTCRTPLLACGAMGMLAEVVGVHTGVPFGRYGYSSALKPSFLGVPIAIGFAWLILFAYAARMTSRLRWRFPWLQIGGALWMVALDLLIDPLASGPLEFWVWNVQGGFGGVPLTNFSGWFAVSLIMFSVFKKPWPGDKTPDWIGLSIIVFFTVIGAARGVMESVIAGLSLAMLHGWIILRKQ
jgi:putative membrane protein